MKVSELIRELEDFLENIGDLDVVKTGEYLGSDSVDGIAFVRAHECLIANDYLDNYTLTTEQKLENVRKDLEEILQNVSCKNCRWCNNVNVGYRCWEREENLQNTKMTEDKLVCFTPNDECEIDRYMLVKIQYCCAKLEKDLKEEQYLEEVSKWK